MKKKYALVNKRVRFPLLIYVAVSCLVFTHLTGQNISRYAITPVGSQNISNDINISQSTGEIAIGFLHSPSITLTQGFQQALIDDSPNPLLFDHQYTDITVYPNPFSQTLNIDLASLQSQEMDISLFDVHGQKKSNITIQESGKNTWFKMDLKQFKNGSYFLLITDKNTNRSKTIKLIKL